MNYTRLRISTGLVLVGFFSLIVILNANEEPVHHPPWYMEVENLIKNGQFQSCADMLEDKVKDSQLDKRLLFDALIIKARAYQYLGLFDRAYDDLVKAQDLASGFSLPDEIQASLRVCDLLLSVGRVSEAVSSGIQVVAKARRHKDPVILAEALNNWGNTLIVGNGYLDETIDGSFDEEILETGPLIAKRGLKITTNTTEMLTKGNVDSIASLLSFNPVKDAVKSYNESSQLALESGHLSLAVRATLNKTRIMYTHRDFDLVIETLSICESLISKLPTNFEKGFLNLTLGLLSMDFAVDPEFNKSFEIRRFAWDAFGRSIEIGEHLGSNILLSHATGFLGQLYERQDRSEEAIQLTQKAIFFANQERMPKVLYQWQWQLARLHKSIGNYDNAIRYYSEAIKTLKKVRNLLMVGYRDVPDIFKTRIKPIYYELAELYIHQSNVAQLTTDRQLNLRNARNTIESMKSVELEDLFQDECVSSFKSKVTDLDNVADGSAVLYPIIFDDRIALLVTFPDGIREYSTKIPASEFETRVKSFRTLLQDESSRAFYRESNQLYQWLIAPLESDLQAHGIDTLVIIPDSVLTLIPFATIHDGEQYLVEKYAVVTTPGLKLVDPVPVERDSANAIIFGLSDAVQGYPALPAVVEEIETVNEILVDGRVFPNQEFTERSVQKEIQEKSFQLIHMATHGEFNSDPEKTFLLTYDKKLTLNQIEDLVKFSKFREKPLELLTLSACQTAVGDERAALGLAGASVKSGARSVLASLWFINDDATKELVTEFYRQYFNNHSISKAKALQNAQKKLIASTDHSHPSRWAPFLIIGNWL